MAYTGTKKSDLVVPEVVADVINAKIEKKIVATRYAAVDTTLVGAPGDTVKVPKVAYVGPAVSVAEGEAIPTRKLSMDTTDATVEKSGLGIPISDEAQNSSTGDPIAIASSQLGISIADKIEQDLFAALMTAPTKQSTATALSYSSIVDAEQLFGEEICSQKVMFVHPNLVGKILKDPMFTSVNSYTNSSVVANGMKGIGTISNCAIVVSSRVEGDATNGYTCPIVKLNSDAETEDDVAAITVFLKADTDVEVDRSASTATTTLYATKHYAAALTNDTRVILAKFK